MWVGGGGVEVPVNNRQIGGTDVRALGVILGRVYSTGPGGIFRLWIDRALGSTLDGNA